MTVYHGVEAVENAVAATFSANLQAVVNKVYSDAADGIPNVTIAQFYAGKRDVVPEYPSVVVSSIEGQQPLDGTLWGEVNHRIDVAIICQSDDKRTLDIQTKRILWAVWDCLKAHQNLDNSLNGLAGVSCIQYGRSEVYSNPKQTGQFLQVAAWEVVVQVEESAF